MDLHEVLSRAVAAGASDVHFKVGQPPFFRTDGELAPAELPPSGMRNSKPFSMRSRAPSRGAVSCSTRRRPRHGLHDRGASALSRQRLPPARRDLVRVPRDPGRDPELRASCTCPPVSRDSPTSSAGWCSSRARPARARRRRSRRCSTRSTARGASTSSRSRTRSRSSTPTASCIVNQREVGLDTESSGRRCGASCVRTPDVILIGELRDAETAQVALQAAESGHLVFSTLHTARRRRDDRPHGRVLPAGEAAAGGLDPRGRPARRGQPAAAPARRTVDGSRPSR